MLPCHEDANPKISKAVCNPQVPVQVHDTTTHQPALAWARVQFKLCTVPARHTRCAAAVEQAGACCSGAHGCGAVMRSGQRRSCGQSCRAPLGVQSAPEGHGVQLPGAPKEPVAQPETQTTILKRFGGRFQQVWQSPFQ